MGRNRSVKNIDLPPYLYRYRHKDGKVRYRLKLESGRYFNFPKDTKKLHAINEVVNYNIQFRSMAQRIKKAHQSTDQSVCRFNIPLEKALNKIFPLIEREELSQGSLKKYQPIMQKLCDDLGTILTHDLNLEMLNAFLKNIMVSLHLRTTTITSAISKKHSVT